LEVIDPNYVPSLEDQDSFRSKQWSMHNVFSKIILTTKGKNCIRDKRISMDDQKVYAKLLEAYHDPLSINLSTTKLRQELTLIKLDDNWRNSYELVLHFWTSKIQDLEGIDDKPVDDKTKRIWLTNTLTSQPEMDAAIRQAITTELTIHGTKGSSTKTSVPWNNFYNIDLSNAKLLDSHVLNKLGAVRKLIKQFEITIPVVIIVIIVPATPIINLALSTLAQIWSWNLVCVLALQIGPNSPKLRKISFSSLRNMTHVTTITANNQPTMAGTTVAIRKMTTQNKQ
jgi:hypothetical protein